MFDNLLMASPIIVIATIALWLVNRRRIKRGQPRYVDHIEDELKASKWLRRRIESAKPYIANAVAWIDAIFGQQGSLLRYC